MMVAPGFAHLGVGTEEGTMPKVKANGIDIHYEVHGAGQPVVLIPGLGADTFLYFRQIPEFSKHFQVIAFDPRGAGESDKPDEPYSIATFAADTAGLLQALGIPRAHIVGASLGGLIAMEFALTYPAMVDRLVLVSTTFGGPHSVKPGLGSLIQALFVARRSGNPEADIRRSFAFFTSKQWGREHADIVDQYVAWRVAHPQPAYAYNRQRAAVPPYNAEDRVGQITAPTMVVHGRNDRLVPVRNAELLAAKIPGAKLLILEDAGHACIIDHAEQFNEAAIEFLKG